jgi:signal transduction histidine kinase
MQAPSSTDRSRRELFIGLGVIAAIFAIQAVIAGLVDRGAEARTRRLYEDSVASIEQVTRIARDVDRQRILADDHIFARVGGGMAAIEQSLAEVAADRREAEAAYAPFVELPNEGPLWRRAMAALDRFDQDMAEVLQFSRQDLDTEARARLTAAVDDYDDLDRTLAELVRLNRAATHDAIRTAEELSGRNEAALWLARLAGFIAVLLFGTWGTRRLARYDEQIASYTRELEERNRDLDAFAGRVAHDLRNALGPVAMAPALLRASSDSPDRVLEVADRTERALGRARAVVDALLAFSRAAKGAEPGESADLPAVMRDVEEELAPIASWLDVSIEVGELPAVRLRCSPGLLHVVLANLCNNAVKYVQDREQRRVRISARPEGTSCRVEVADTGPGIPIDAREKIFEPFFRLEGTRAPGVGIGLTTVRRILDARGGRIQVESAPDEGARFVFWLPIVPPPAPPA